MPLNLIEAMVVTRQEQLVEERADAPDGRLSLGILPELLGYHLRRTQVAVFKHFAKRVASEGLTPGLCGMLQVIAANPGLSQSRLAEAMGVERSNIVKVVRQLDAAGLIERIGSPNDRRSNCLYPSLRGEQAVQRMEAEILRHEREVASELTTAERDTLIGLLDRVYRQAQ